MSFNIFVIETIGFTNSNLFDYVNHLYLFTSTTKPFLNVSYLFFTQYNMFTHIYIHMYISDMQVYINIFNLQVTYTLNVAESKY